MKKTFKYLYSYTQLQSSLIATSMQYVPKYGWNDNAIHAACAVMDLSPASHRLVSPYDLITHSMQVWNKDALRTITDTNFGGRFRITEKIHYAIMIRLQLQMPYIDTWHQAMAIGAMPTNISTTKSLLWAYSDQVWRQCGDNSTDYNYYTKRILFNAAYAATELHLLTDQSIENSATSQFLQRRLSDIIAVGKGVGELKTVTEALVDGAWSLLGIFKEVQIKHPITSQTSPNKQAETKQAVKE